MAHTAWSAGVDESGCDAERSYRACFAREAAEEENPFAGLTLPSQAKPAFADMDRDGDLDMFVGAQDGTIRYYPNIGSVYKPIYREAAWEENPLRPPPGGPNGRHRAFADMDNDGDLDLFFGTTDGVIRYYENIGDVGKPVFSERFGPDNPLDEVDVGYYSAPALADLDKDGDRDMLIGAQDGTLHYFENTGDVGNPVFSEHFGSDNPLDGVDVGDYSTPTLADLDKDGDWEALIGAYDGTLRYFENTGGANNPVFSERIGPDNPLDGVDAGFRSTPALADLDNDSDWDALIGTEYGRLRYFENTGGAGNPVFNERLGLDNPLDKVDIGRDSAPVLADLDNDGDWDALIGTEFGRLRYFENSGDANNPVFKEHPGSENPLDWVDVGKYSAPALADLDNDGDWDALIGAWHGTLRYFENIGGTGKPVFSERTGPDNPLDEVDVGYGSAPALTDLDNDGDLDALIGRDYGMPHYFENTGSVGSPVFNRRLGPDNPLGGEGIYGSAPALADLDNDGDWDALIDDAWNGAFRYFENTGNASNPVFSERLGPDSPFDEPVFSERLGPDSPFEEMDNSAPALADLDNDGDWDVVISDLSGGLRYFENTGNVGKLIFSEYPGTDNPLNDAYIHGSHSPALADLDNDGDLDALISDLTGRLHYFENTGNVGNPVFSERLNTDNRLFFGDVYWADDIVQKAFPALADLDNDGDWDALIGMFHGMFYYFENTGGAGNPVFSNRFGPNNPLDGVEVGNDAAPALTDLDNDGDWDALIGAFDGTLRYFENTGGAGNLMFSERLGPDNPLDGVDVGYSSAPALADLDNDGDWDVLIGESTGTFRYFENTGGASNAVFSERFGPDNPLDEVDVGQSNAPALADLDNDGDRDALIGADGTFRYFENTRPANEALPPLHASFPGGFYNAQRHPLDIQLRCLDDCLRIHYTLDGSIPDPVDSSVFGEPLSVTATTTVKFFSVDALGNPGTVRIEQYTIDNDAPGIRITSPLDGGSVGAIPVIEGETADNLADAGLQRIELQIQNGPLYFQDNARDPMTTAFTWIRLQPEQNWSYKLADIPFPSGTYTITARAFDRAGNVSEPHTITVTVSDPAFSTLTLYTGHPAIMQNDPLDISGKLTQFGAFNTNLEGMRVKLNILDESGDPLGHEGPVTQTNRLGQYRFNDVDLFSQKGVFGLQTCFEGAETLMKSCSNRGLLLVGRFAGYAILVQGRIANREGLKAHDKTLDRVYKQLKARGFLDQNIRYFSYANNPPVAVETPDKAEIQDAVVNWAAARMDGSPAPLYVILVDHGHEDGFILDDNSMISAEDMNQWLNSLESQLVDRPNNPLAEPRVVIVGSCFSGAFIHGENSLSKAGRLLISSATETEVSYKGPLETDGIRGGSYFIDTLFRLLGRGETFRNAFTLATADTERFTRRNAISVNSAGEYGDDAAQHPLLDDNGDGRGGNTLYRGGDGDLAA
ncbi:MAG: hypothetical protein GY862_22605 [Gammaproteobacteria bacterium]|nr:hypothetical protein [Gammaproteobacteria bacterium]